MLMEMKVLRDVQLQNIHEKTLYLLEKVGIAIKHGPTIELLAEHGARVEGGLVKFPPKLVNDTLALAPDEFLLSGRNRERSVRIGNGSLVCAPTSGEVFVQDMEGGRREGTLQDLTNFIKLCQSSDAIGVTDVAVVDPSDLKGNETVCRSMLEGIRNSDKPLQGLSGGVSQSELSIQMAEIATQATRKEHFIIGIANTFSPLAWDQNMLEAIWSYSGANQPVVITCCSLGGVTAPISLAGSMVQNNAEILAGVVLSQLIRPTAPVVYGNTSSVADMKTMALATGAPEYALLETASCQLARYYHLPFRGGGGLTDAKDVDVQAGIESTSSLLCAFANRVDYIMHALGMMNGFMTVSYEKWIVDEEICARARRFFNGMDELTDETMDVIQEIGAGGNFLSHKSTINNFRTALFIPAISDRDNWDNWQDNKRSILLNANRAWKRRLAEFQDPHLCSEVDKELLAFVEKHV
jgi:trimethylamine--corrinoid protein Co-methyltransferase